MNKIYDIRFVEKVNNNETYFIKMYDRIHLIKSYVYSLKEFFFIKNYRDNINNDEFEKIILYYDDGFLIPYIHRGSKRKKFDKFPITILKTYSFKRSIKNKDNLEELIVEGSL